ncbi:MerR family transcriptional regulator [Subdoligranulum variabile]|uniref:MerR family transcriptional regulator n=1 Tax=Subdoligranulum variabile TaxID=214851 RepID=UPI0026EAD780|nr:MerR family transcriptional regulator [Subdoligranulum variabile]
MNIKQAAEASGVSSRNIRYYEQEGLLCPTRNPENDYRIYTDQDVRTLKLIRALRMLDMPLEDIRAVLRGSLSLASAAARQAERLQKRTRELEAAIHFCADLQQRNENASSMDVDACLMQMQAEPAKGWFTAWVNDYRAMAHTEHRRSFTFTPDTPVTTPAEFTDALFAYAREQHLDLVVTRESMNPSFTIDGVEYRAVRYYYPFRGIPTARIRCLLCDPDFAEPEMTPRLRIMKMLHYAMPVLAAAAIALLFLLPRGLLSTWWGVLILVCCIAAGVSNAWYNARIFYNDKDNQDHYH